MNLVERISAARAAFRGSPKANINTSRELAAYMAHHNQAGSAFECSAVLRCVDILSTSLAMLPFRIIDTETFEEQIDHPLYEKLMYEPNNWQTSFEFMRLMELRRITEGNAYALIVRAGNRVVSLQPIRKDRIRVKQNVDWSINYHVLRPDGEWYPVPKGDMLHIRDLSIEGLEGCSRTKLVANAIATAKAADTAQKNIFLTGSMAGGYFKHKGKLGDEAFDRLKAQIEGRSGPENAGKWWLLEDDMEAKQFAMSARDAQSVEVRKAVLEDIARSFGVPRPLMMMDDTSWGSGVKELATLFVRFGLAPSMVAWEQACRRVLLSAADKRNFTLDIDESVLLRGSIIDQGEYFAKALGAGGHKPWMESDEVRKAVGLRSHEQGSGLVMMGKENAKTE